MNEFNHREAVTDEAVYGVVANSRAVSGVRRAGTRLVPLNDREAILPRREKWRERAHAGAGPGNDEQHGVIEAGAP